MRIFILAFATAAILFSATTATAIEFSVVGPTSASVLPGEDFTINFRMTHDSQVPTNGIGASVTDYGANSFVSGRAVFRYLATVCVAPGICLGGLENIAGQPSISSNPFSERALSESSIGAFDNRVQFALSASLASVIGTPGIDQGLDELTGTAQFSVTFTALEDALIQIGTSYQGDGVIIEGGASLEAQGATFQLNVIPEPSTALLMGLGLTGLAASGRSLRSRE